MGKIAMGRSIGDAYDLTFGRYFALFGVVWLPLVLILAGEVFFLMRFGPMFADIFRFAAQHPKSHEIPPHEFQMQGLSWAMNLFFYVMLAWLRVGVTKAALNLPRGPSFAYFFVGMDELRVLGGYLVFLALYIAAMIGLLLAAVAVAAVVSALYAGGAFDLIDKGILVQAGITLAIAAGLGLLSALIYVQIRLLYLFVPITVVEKRFGLWRSWEMSEGNFWRIVVVSIGTLSPLVILEFVLLFVFYIPFFVILIATARHHPEMAHHPELIPAVLLGAFAKAGIYLGPVAAVLGFVLAPIVCGLSFAPPAYAYRTLTGKPAA